MSDKDVVKEAVNALSGVKNYQVIFYKTHEYVCIVQAKSQEELEEMLDTSECVDLIIENASDKGSEDEVRDLSDIEEYIPYKGEEVQIDVSYEDIKEIWDAE